MADESDGNPDQRWRTVSIYDSYLWMTGTPVRYNLRRYLSALACIDAIETASLPDAELRVRFAEARTRAADGELLDSLLARVYALVREACSRMLGMRPFDVQVMAGVALHQRKLVQLDTGEGKTLVAVLPAVLDALKGKGVHVLTANDYLARRDAEWMSPAYQFFGLRAGYVQQGMSILERQAAYAADITYLTAK